MHRFFRLLLLPIFFQVPVFGADLDLRSARVATPEKLSVPEAKAVAMLVDEVAKRTLIRWPIATSSTSGPTIVLERAAAGGPPEGFELRSDKSGVVRLLANDARGMLFGVGRLLRELRMRRGSVTLDDSLKIESAPRYPIRGHQLGYRPKTNSYDGWDLHHWEQYYRDLAVFGCNAIELIPPRSDDDADSPHFPRPPLEMMAGMSQLCHDYGLDAWIWYPALDKDYGDPETVEFALKEWEAVYQKLPRIDAVFVPGGDPGHTRPRHLLNLLQKQAASLKRHHPKAQMWVSPQSFTGQWMEEFLAILRDERPDWLAGLVHGPQVRMSLPDLRKAVPEKYPIRRYPDITHSLRCQYPVPDWDLAHALTSSREPINPRPRDQANIFRQFEKSAVGFITYSEGCNDDVNKAVWSGLGWDPSADVVDILRQYSRYFIGPEYEESYAQGLLALEGNWRGPLLTNASVDVTLQQFQALERKAGPSLQLNWRFQQSLYRAYYDAYQRARLIYETDLEQRALEALRQAGRTGTMSALQRADAALDQAVTERVAPDLWARVHELAEALYQSIRMQLSVNRYKAIAVGRGATLDTVDAPLNNRAWLKGKFAAIRRLDGEAERLSAIDAIINWTNPGPGGFYDDLGNPSQQPHLLRDVGPAKDPGFLRSSLAGFTIVPSWRLSWCNHAETFYEQPLRMRYSDLDPAARYRLRVLYAGDDFRSGLRLMANDKIEIHKSAVKPNPPRPLEFDIPEEATKSGELLLSWTQEPGKGGNGRGCQVAEVWLMRR